MKRLFFGVLVAMVAGCVTVPGNSAGVNVMDDQAVEAACAWISDRVDTNRNGEIHNRIGIAGTGRSTEIYPSVSNYEYVKMFYHNMLCSVVDELEANPVPFHYVIGIEDHRRKSTVFACVVTKDGRVINGYGYKPFLNGGLFFDDFGPTKKELYYCGRWVANIPPNYGYTGRLTMAPPELDGPK